MTRSAVLWLTLVAACALLIFGNCSFNEHPDPPTLLPPDLLPAATQTGANTFGCLVDGIAWQVDTASLAGSSVGADASVRGKLVLTAVQQLAPGTTPRTVRIVLTDTTTVFAKGEYYLWSMPGSSHNDIIVSSDAGNFANYSGTLTLTRFDRQARIAAGTFYFSSSACPTLSDGRFDIGNVQF